VLDTGFHVYKVLSRTITGWGQLLKSSRKLFFCGARLCHEHKMREVCITFSLLRKNGRWKPEMFFF
jgi:hypothetical protein